MSARKTLLVTVLIFALFAAIDLIVALGVEHEELWYQVPGFFALLGFLGCLLLIVVAKTLGHELLHRREDYYDR